MHAMHACSSDKRKVIKTSAVLPTSDQDSKACQQSKLQHQKHRKFQCQLLLRWSLFF